MGRGGFIRDDGRWRIDPVPPDFFLFDALKGQLAGRLFESADELVEEICEMTTAIPRAKLEIVFLEWKERL
jgi:hypothetical protein